MEVPMCPFKLQVEMKPCNEAVTEAEAFISCLEISRARVKPSRLNWRLEAFSSVIRRATHRAAPVPCGDASPAAENNNL
jgi:hypothetical protein